MIPRIYSPTETDFSTNGLGILKDATKCEIYEVANGKYELELEYPLGTRFDEYFENDYQIKAKPNDQEEYHIFFIDDKDIDTFLDTITIYAQSRTNRLGRRAVTFAEVDSKTGREAMAIIENNMDKKSDISLYSDITTVSSTTFEARNVLNCIAGEQGSLLQYWGGEIKREPFKLSLLKRRGRDNIGTIRYGKDLSGLKVKLDWTGVKTRIIPYADPQSDTGTTSRIYGSPVDSEYINNYPDVYTEHVQFTEEQGVKDVNSLNKIAKNYFKTINPGCDKPKISITVEFDKLTDTEEGKEFAKIRNYGLFDTFKIYHRKYKLYFESKVSGVQYDSLSEKVLKLEAGDTQVAFYQQQAVTIQDKLKDYATNNYMSSFNDYVSSMITGQGNAGGYVVLWPKEKPSNIFIMDSPDLNKAKEVLRMNKNGIAFSKNGWNGPFNSAWTLDSIFNANFIQTGLIKADIFQNSFNKTGDVLKLVNGLLQIWNNKKKIMELTKKGMEFWNSNSSIGTIGTTDSAGNPFPGASTPTPIEDNSLVIRTNGDGKYILISPKVGKGLVLLGNGKAIYFGDLDVQGKLTVKGKEIIPGQGGGPSGGGESTGGYPSELKTDAEKRAWRIYDILCNNGFTKQSACGILGNIQQETGGTFDPDTVQIGGPAYGIVQWDGSSYPLVGPATWDGKVYVQNLFNAAGIKEPITSLDAQVRLLIWTFTNGQWMGVVQPTTFDGFKACTDTRQAAYAFERNYERPAATHPERQDYAVNWYNKFKDLKPGGATGEAGLKHLESLIGQRIGNGQCYALSAEYSGYLGGCGMGAGTKYGLTHVIGNTSAASDIGIAYDWSAVGWKVIQNPRYDQLVVGAIINWARGGQVGSWFADGTYGHTGVIRGLANGRMQTYEQNTELGMICGKLDRQYYSASAISSIVIPPK
ncbi:CHAP domain-containing protein [Enterococcus hirae]|uniref:phage tail spike protein n=2 Tax=Enterococcus TaxID=1350 RepID=UPI000FF87F62|nr:phage tail spike protein [Enterococcus hirae]EMF0167238.1 phage tail protein [Enterococcus hirae]EMF0190184.1 phage tail protein [Enterococcus hirae]EMF0221628.1 phage tail protein [Enterococcus hirae]EMF0248880.1 phage tail protein [Enterococcus hirae]EMF0251343.1 phage tail protein [Enterococcus hirae]